MIKKCKNCGRDFETGKGNKRYCKEDCFREIRREQHRDEYYRNIETHTRCSKAYYETHKEQWGEYQKRKRAKIQERDLLMQQWKGRLIRVKSGALIIVRNAISNVGQKLIMKIIVGH